MNTSDNDAQGTSSGVNDSITSWEIANEAKRTGQYIMEWIEKHMKDLMEVLHELMEGQRRFGGGKPGRIKISQHLVIESFIASKILA